MKKKTRIFQIVSVLTLMLFFVAVTRLGTDDDNVVVIGEDEVPLGSSPSTVQPTNQDARIIPDKYNTGATGRLNRAEIGETISGIVFVGGNNGTANVLDFPLRNPDVSGTVTIDNMDFSDYQLSMYHENQITSNIKVIFNNCKFARIVTGREEYNISYEFNNCSINSFYGSNSEFNNCRFGSGYTDCMVPFVNVTVNDSFFCDMASDDVAGTGVHTDGTQIYGIAGLDVENVNYNNCRFEIPAIAAKNSINACIMLQLEYSNAKNLHFRDCIVNGGGYSIYARDKGVGMTFTDVTFENIAVGCARVYGTIYPDVSSQIKFNNLCDTQSLYVSSVWKENNNIHISVTNDTNQERTLTVYSDGEIFDFTIPACPTGSELYSSYDRFPFDIDIVIEGDKDYVVCYDSTIKGAAKQIRCCSWGNGLIELTPTARDYLYNSDSNILSSGECGNDIEYTIYTDGLLSLQGTGSTYAYNSAKTAPWMEYSYMINKVEIGEGIEQIGAQAFKDCSGIESVEFPESLTEIGARSFTKCFSLNSISLHDSVSIIGDYAFYGTILQQVEYYGEPDTWRQIQIGSNSGVNSDNVMYIAEKEQYKAESVTYILEGSCGQNIDFKLTEDGKLILSGYGGTYDYNSAKKSPWADYNGSINTVVIDDGIERLGNQLFAQCDGLQRVEISDTVKEIGVNCFIKCKNLTCVEIPKSITSIEKYAFAGTGLKEAKYNGSISEFSKVFIGIKNEKLIDSIFYTE